MLKPIERIYIVFNGMTNSLHILPIMCFYLTYFGIYFDLHSNIGLNYLISFNEINHVTLKET